MISNCHSLLSFRYLRMKLPREDPTKQNYNTSENIKIDFEEDEELRDDLGEDIMIPEFEKNILQPELLDLNQFPELSQIF